jgi:hypothetical protein
MATRGSACPELRATQGPEEEEEVGILARAYARFAPNFGPGPVGNGAIRAENGPRTTSEVPPQWNFATAWQAIKIPATPLTTSLRGQGRWRRPSMSRSSRRSLARLDCGE